jgi:hypothetical protein
VGIVVSGDCARTSVVWTVTFDLPRKSFQKILVWDVCMRGKVSEYFAIRSQEA